jgi:hypothetical protein
MERRVHPRQAVRFLAQHQLGPDEGLEVDYVKDLSKSGLFISTKRELKKDATLLVHFSPKRDSHMVTAFCKVTRVTPEGVGAEFVNLDQHASHLISQVLA